MNDSDVCPHCGELALDSSGDGVSCMNCGSEFADDEFDGFDGEFEGFDGD
jgi:ribosomal protein L37AE/L43A